MSMCPTLPGFGVDQSIVLIHSVWFSVVLIVPRCNIKNAHALNYLDIKWVFSGLCTIHEHNYVIVRKKLSVA